MVRSPETPFSAGALSRADFEKRLRKLKEGDLGAARDNPGSYACEGCTSCVDCTFCTKCESLRNCHYVVDCQRCGECSHCSRCVDCHGASHCTACTRCTAGAYLVECTDCHGCTYCFGCVGLSRKDFHILNEPYERTEYFRITKQLAEALGHHVP